jgi:hypothetical protein
MFVCALTTSLRGAAQVADLRPEEMLKLLPSTIDGFSPTGKFRSKQMKVGTITYTLCEKKFNVGTRSIVLLLFDFSHADIMYKQAMKTWNEAHPVETDSIVLRAVALDNCTGWESYRKRTRQSQIFLGICGRYFLNMTGDQVALPELKLVFKDVALDKFPK